MTRWRRGAALILICSALAACVGEDGPHGMDGPREAGGGRPMRPLPNVFISPAGEPFRAGPGAAYPVSTWFARADANHDGRLSAAEFRADGMAFFDRVDTNHDGVVDGLELQTYEQTIAPEILPHIESLRSMEGMDADLTFGDPANSDNRPERRRGSGQSARAPTSPTGVGTQGAAVYSMTNTPEPIAAADERLDGRVTRAEFADAMDRRFASLDKSGAGYLSLAGLPKTPIQAEILRRAAAAKRAAAHGRPPPTDHVTGG